MAPLYYPIEVVQYIAQISGIWILVHIVAIFLPGWNNSLIGIKIWKNKFRSIVYGGVLFLMRKKIYRQENGLLRHSHENVWGIQFLAIIITPSLIALIVTGFFWTYGFYLLADNLFWAILSFAISFVTLFAIMPSYKEIQTLFNTTSSSDWRWFGKGITTAIITYFILQFLSVSSEIIYFVIIPILFFPWSEKEKSKVSKTDMISLPVKVVEQEIMVIDKKTKGSISLFNDLS